MSSSSVSCILPVSIPVPMPGSPAGSRAWARQFPAALMPLLLLPASPTPTNLWHGNSFQAIGSCARAQLHSAVPAPHLGVGREGRKKRWQDEHSFQLPSASTAPYWLRTASVPQVVGLGRAVVVCMQLPAVWPQHR